MGYLKGCSRLEELKYHFSFNNSFECPWTNASSEQLKVVKAPDPIYAYVHIHKNTNLYTHNSVLLALLSHQLGMKLDFF